MAIEDLSVFRSGIDQTLPKQLRHGSKIDHKTIHVLMKRMYLRVLPYTLPQQEAKFENFSDQVYLTIARASLMAIVRAEGQHKENSSILTGIVLYLRSVWGTPQFSGNQINPAWVQSEMLESLIMPYSGYGSEKVWRTSDDVLLKGLSKILDAYDLAPTDVSEGRGEYYSTQPENLGADLYRMSKADDLWQSPLFLHGEINSACKHFWQGFKGSWGNGSWSFWREWYQGFLDGKPMDWELQRRVAMIPDEDWEKGPEHIARVIEDIRTRFALKQRLAELENEMAVLTERNRHGIGGNNPPEEIAQEKVIQDFLIEPVQELQTQVQAETPDKSRVRKAVEKLTALLVVAGKWTGGKLDKAVDECVKSIGKRAGDSLFAWVVLNSAAITGIVSLARTWLNLP